MAGIRYFLFFNLFFNEQLLFRWRTFLPLWLLLAFFQILQHIKQPELAFTLTLCGIKLIL